MHDLERLWTWLVADLGWVDISALTVLALFFLLGLWRGMMWQLGRAVTWLGSYAAAVLFGPALARHVFTAPEPDHPQTYLAYVATFLLAFVLLSGTARLLQAMVRRVGLGVLDRLAGGVFGVGTGSVVVFGALAVVLMFGKPFGVYGAAQASKTAAVSRVALGLLGDKVPEPLRAAFAAPEPARVASRPQRAHTPDLDDLLERRDRRREPR